LQPKRNLMRKLPKPRVAKHRAGQKAREMRGF